MEGLTPGSFAIKMFMALEFEQLLLVIDLQNNGGIDLHFVTALVFLDREHPTSLVPTLMTPLRSSTLARPVHSLSLFPRSIPRAKKKRTFP